MGSPEPRLDGDGHPGKVCGASVSARPRLSPHTSGTSSGCFLGGAGPSTCGMVWHGLAQPPPCSVVAHLSQLRGQVDRDVLIQGVICDIRQVVEVAETIQPLALPRLPQQCIPVPGERGDKVLRGRARLLGQQAGGRANSEVGP